MKIVDVGALIRCCLVGCSRRDPAER